MLTLASLLFLALHDVVTGKCHSLGTTLKIDVHFSLVLFNSLRKENTLIKGAQKVVQPSVLFQEVKYLSFFFTNNIHR